MNRFAVAIGAPLKQIYIAYKAIVPTLLDPEETPARFLDWLMSVVALPLEYVLTDGQKRALIASAIQVWATKGTPESIEYWIRGLTDITAEVVSLDGEGFVAGVSMAGDVCGIVTPFWSYIVRVPTGSIPEAELRRLLVPIVPTFCVYTVEFI